MGAADVEVDRKHEAEAMGMVEELILKGGSKIEPEPLSIAERDKGEGVGPHDMNEKVSHKDLWCIYIYLQSSGFFLYTSPEWSRLITLQL